jgi:hypothetical protein
MLHARAAARIHAQLQPRFGACVDAESACGDEIRRVRCIAGPRPCFDETLRRETCIRPIGERPEGRRGRSFEGRFVAPLRRLRIRCAAWGQCRIEHAAATQQRAVRRVECFNALARRNRRARCRQRCLQPSARRDEHHRADEKDDRERRASRSATECATGYATGHVLDAEALRIATRRKNDWCVRPSSAMEEVPSQSM